MDVVEKVSLHDNISSSANQKSSKIFNIMEKNYSVNCWCRNTSSIIDIDNPCPKTPRYAFWEKFSILLAESAKGIVFWAGYGKTKNNTYRPNSCFAKYEFPYLTSDVKKFV